MARGVDGAPLGIVHCDVTPSNIFVSSRGEIKLPDPLPDEVLDIALMSDGLEPLAVHFASRKAHEPFFRTVLAPLHGVAEKGESAVLSTGLSAMLTSPAVRLRTDDDASLVIATRRA